MKHVGVLMGGLSAEREISLKTGEAVAKALTDRGYDVQRDLRRPGPRPGAAAEPNRRGVHRPARPLRRGRLRPGPARADGHPLHRQRGARERARHGQAQVQGALPALQRARRRPYYVVDAERHGRRSRRSTARSASRSSSSRAGPARASAPAGPTTWASCARASTDAAQYDDSILVERFVAGREVTVGVLDGRALGAMEIVPKGAFYDYRSKYQPGQSDYHFPARLSPTRYKGVLNIAERAAACLGVGGRGARRHARDRGRERVRARGQHAPGDDADLAAAEDRGGRGHRLRRALRGDPGAREHRRHRGDEPEPESEDDAEVSSAGFYDAE